MKEGEKQVGQGYCYSWVWQSGCLRPDFFFCSLFPLCASSFCPRDPARASRSLRCSGRAGSGLLHSSRKTAAGGQRCGCLSGNGKAALFLLFVSSPVVRHGRTVLRFKLISEMAARPVPWGLYSCNYTKIQLGPNPCSGCWLGLADSLLPPQHPPFSRHSQEPSWCLRGFGCPQPCCLPALPHSLPSAQEGSLWLVSWRLCKASRAPLLLMEPSPSLTCSFSFNGDLC